MKEKKVDKMMVVEADLCSGCLICALTCSRHHFGEYNPKRSHIKLIRNWETDVSIVTLDEACDYCGACVEVCPRKCIRFVTTNEAAVIRKQNKIGTFPVPLVRAEAREAVR